MKQLLLIGGLFMFVILIVIVYSNRQANKRNEQMLSTIAQINTDSATEVKKCSKDWLCATTSILGGVGNIFSNFNIIK